MQALKYTIDIDGDVYVYIDNKAVYLNELNVIDIDELNEIIYLAL